MADNKFDTPELREYPIIPKLQKDVMAHSKPFIAMSRIKSHWVSQANWSMICTM